jgi:hypothetical protein
MSKFDPNGNQPMLKYTEDGTPKAIPVPRQAADHIAEMDTVHMERRLYWGGSLCTNIGARTYTAEI